MSILIGRLKTAVNLISFLLGMFIYFERTVCLHEQRISNSVIFWDCLSIQCIPYQFRFLLYQTRKYLWFIIFLFKYWFKILGFVEIKGAFKFCADSFVQVLIVMIESLKILNGDASVRLMDRIDKILRLDWIVEVLR